MLEFKEIKNSNDRITLLKDFDIELGLWIVPYIQTKHDLQNFYMNSHKSLIKDPFKTISEFQEEILLSCYPELQIVSEGVIQTFIKNELNTHQEKQYRFSGSAYTIFKLLSHLLPIFSHIEGPELLSQLIQENAMIKQKWGKHLLEAMKIWKKLEKQFIVPSWIPSLLAHRDLPIHQKTIVVDMKCDLSKAEMEIFEKLAKENHIVILHPGSSWFQKYPNEFFAYNFQKPLPFVLNSHSVSKEKNIISKRFTSMLSEVKDAIVTTRQWIDQGIDPNQIVISAPSIKNYLPVLKTYLDFEGIPYRGPSVIEAHSLPEIVRWISKMQLQLKFELQPYALELAVFGNHRSKMSYEEFHHFYHQILDPEDYKRCKPVYDDFIKNKMISKDTKLTAFEFLKYACQIWDKGENSIKEIHQILNTFISDTKRLPSLKASYWLEIIKSIVSKINITSKPSGGIYLSDFSVADHLSIKKIYMMGLSEEELKGERYSLLNNLDILSINDQLGFFLEPVEKSPLEFYVDWIISNTSLDKVISFPETNFLGEVLNPSILWLNCQTETAASSSKTRIDQVQLQNLRIADSLITSDQNYQEDIDPTLKNILQDKGLIDAAHFLPYSPSSLSVGSLERYHKCPFIFYMEDVLKMKEPISLDMDMSPLTQGILTHALLSDLTKEPFCAEWTNQKLDELIEAHIVKENILFGEEAFKNSFKETQIKKLQEFLQFENDWRKTFLQTKTILREAEIQAYIDAKGQVRSRPFKGGILIRGRLDRLDEVGDDIFSVIDYKSSHTGKTNYKTWLEKGDFQLGLYALMIKEGCLEGVSGDVVSAVYFGMKEMKRDKGFLMEAYNGLAHNISTHHHKMNVEEQKDFFEKLQEEIGRIISLILQGEFSPRPRNKDLCQDCQWRNVCKAPHLI